MEEEIIDGEGDERKDTAHCEQGEVLEPNFCNVAEQHGNVCTNIRGGTRKDKTHSEAEDILINSLS